MSNMSHCRFENTSKDLEDCVENWDSVDVNDLEDSNYEREAKIKIVGLAIDILEMEGFTVIADDDEE